MNNDKSIVFRVINGEKKYKIHTPFVPVRNFRNWFNKDKILKMFSKDKNDDNTKYVTILKNINFSLLKECKLVIVVGDSGEGKSVLLDVLSGLTNFNSGRVFWNGVEQDKNIRNATFLHKKYTILHTKSSEEYYTNFANSTQSLIYNFIFNFLTLKWSMRHNINNKKINFIIQKIKFFFISRLKEMFPLQYERMWESKFNVLSRGQKGVILSLLVIIIAKLGLTDIVLLDELFSGISESKFKTLIQYLKNDIILNEKLKHVVICTHNQLLIKTLYVLTQHYKIHNNVLIVINKKMIKLRLEDLFFSSRYLLIFQNEEKKNNFINKLHSNTLDKNINLLVLQENKVQNIQQNIYFQITNNELQQNTNNKIFMSKISNIQEQSKKMEITITFFGTNNNLKILHNILVVYFPKLLEPISSIDYVLTYKIQQKL